MTSRIGLALIVAAEICTGCADSRSQGESTSGLNSDSKSATFDDQVGADLRDGRFRTRRSSTDPSEEEFDALSAIGYSAGTQEAPSESGVTRHVQSATSAGLNFFVSGHAPTALLMDMSGEIIHSWAAKFEDIWPDHADVSDRADSKFWRRAYLFPNGDVIAIFESLGIVKLNRNSEVIWKNSIQVHHDFQIEDSGDLYALVRRITHEPSAVDTVRNLSNTRVESKRDERVSILQDYVVYFDEELKAVRTLSILECFENSESEHPWRRAALTFWSKEEQRSLIGSHRDIFHTNSLEVLDGSIADRVPAFAKGNYLVSLRHLDMIAVLDPNAKQVVWSLAGASVVQHDAQITSDGHLLYFDNQWQPGRTRIVIMDALTREPVWEYGTEPGQDLYSETCGTVQELPNQNLLITETDGGRAIEVTREGQVVWEFYNPYGVGDNDELIASLFEIVRLESDFPTEWMETAER